MKHLIDCIIKMAIFLPVTFSTITFLVLWKTELPFSLLAGIAMFVGIGFYYAINAMINFKMVNQYVGCRLKIQDEDFICSCGSRANMYIAETDAEETRVIIQCSDNSCCVSVQAYSITSAKLGWEAIS